ncbi:trigger factor [Candidatus Similichlamydia laticola]|uniref:Cell division trigger factor n=1 Tax=Candidatus Similichlamydia laticola TaxID=2170265 RepID=A0A369KLA6_9BACT|nr:trigger factor [Candidatus Similichlamydia laticola]RDB31796.1 Cell division trigger factor [Candidatus Similichlamydia laticola]
MSENRVDILSKEVLPNCLLELVVSVPSSLVTLCREEAINKIVKTVSLPGFRKGRVPRHHVMDSFGQKIQLEWQESLAKLVAQDAVKILGVRTIPPVIYKWKKLSDTSDAELQLSLETYPQDISVEALDFSSLSPPQRKEVTDEVVQNKIDEYRGILAEWVTLDEDIPLSPEDRINYRLLAQTGEEVGKGKGCLVKEMDPCLRDALLKMGTREGEVNLAQDCSSLPAGVYRVHVLQADRKDLPPLDTAFAQRFHLQSVDELRSEMKKRLQSSLDFDYLEEAKSVLQDALVEQLLFELPQSLLEREVESRSSFASNQGLTKEEVEEQARHALRLFFFIESIAIQHRIQLTPEHRDFIWSQNPPGPQGESGRQRMAAQLMQHEVLLFLLQRIGWINPN